MYDVIVVGARCAGSTTAMLLARRGYRILLVDKPRVPSDMICSHYIHQPGIAALKRWGLAERVEASGSPPVTEITFDAGAVRLVGSAPEVDGVGHGHCVRRGTLDEALIAAAVDAGAELCDDFTVTEVLRDAGRVCGVRGRRRGSAAETARARLVIGADGVNSIVAGSVDAAYTRYVPPLTCAYYAHFHGLPTGGLELYTRRGCFISAAPTNDHLTCITVFWPGHQHAKLRLDIEQSFLGSLEHHASSLFDRTRRAERVEKLTGTPPLPNYVRKPWGPGWALVGDAGYLTDPITAQGISDAFRDAGLLAGAVNAGFVGRAPMDQALAWYERQRDAATSYMFQHTCELARLEAMPPQMLDILTALRDRPEEICRFFGTITGATSIPEFFARENFDRILGNPVAA